MGESFILDYILLVFFGSCGVFQAAAASNGLWGLMLFRSPAISFLLGIALLAGAVTWFFVSEPRSLPDTGAGLTGNEQFGYFFTGGGAGLAFTLPVTSIRNSRLGGGLSDMAQGMDALTKSNYPRTLHRIFKHLNNQGLGAEFQGWARNQHAGASDRRLGLS